MKILLTIFLSLFTINAFAATSGVGAGGAETSTGWTKSGTNVTLTSQTDNVGIGTDSTSDYSLEITAMSTKPPFGISSTNSTSGDWVIVDATGNVGIKTTTPLNSLDVGGTRGVTIGTSYAGINAAPTNGLIVQGNVGIGTFLSNSNNPVMSIRSMSTSNHLIDFFKSSSPTNSPITYIDGFGNPVATVFEGNGPSTASLPTLIDNQDSTTGVVFPTTGQISLATNSSERLRIDSAGNVGIGTTITSNAGLSIMNGNVGIGTWIPNTAMVIGNPVASTPVLGDLLLNGTGASAQLDIGNGSNGSTTENLFIGYNTTSDFSFITSIHQGASRTPIMLNQPGGNVGIGTLLAGQALTIGGAGSKIRFSDANSVSWSCGPAVTTGVFTCTNP